MAETREEILLNAIATGGSVTVEPITRKEQYLAKIAGLSTDYPDEPITREEILLAKIVENGTGGGGGDTPTQTKSLDVVENGSYTVTPDSGYALSSVSVSVNVPIPEYETWEGGAY